MTNPKKRLDVITIRLSPKLKRRAKAYAMRTNLDLTKLIRILLERECGRATGAKPRP